MTRLSFSRSSIFYITVLYQQRRENILTMRKCNPAQATKIMEVELSRGKNLQQALELVIKNKAFDGSKACITFIREEAMNSRESTPLIFNKLWLD